MKKQLILFLLCLNFFIINVSGQGPIVGNPSSIYRSATGRQRSPQEVEIMRSLYEQQRRHAQFERLRNLGNSLVVNSSASAIDSLYTREQRRFINNLSKPNEPEKARYGQFLKHSNTGFTTFPGEGDCIRKSEEDCISQTLPGKGAYFSFRLKNYIHPGWADLGLKQNWFFSVGYLTQSIFVELGDVPIEDLTLQNNGMKFLTEFVPANNLEDANKQRVELEKGVEAHNFFYFNAVKAVPNQTYALRSVAYQGKFITILNFGKSKSKIDWLNGDERRDVIVVFRVIGKDEKGNLKIVWRELQSRNSLKLETPVQEINPSQINKLIKIID